MCLTFRNFQPSRYIFYVYTKDVKRFTWTLKLNFETLLLDPSLNLRPQKERTIFTDEQMLILERAFQRDKHPNPDVRQLIAELTALSVERVRIWYQNRRAKVKRDEEDELALLAEQVTIFEKIFLLVKKVGIFAE